MDEQGNNIGGFEQSWRAALGEESVTPPQKVWAELDRALANAELITAKKQIGLYKWAAAAAVFFGVTAGVVALTNQLVFDFERNSGQIVITQKSEVEEPPTEGNFSGYAIFDPGAIEADSKAVGKLSVTVATASSPQQIKLTPAAANGTLLGNSRPRRSKVQDQVLLAQNTISTLDVKKQKVQFASDRDFDHMLADQRVNRVPVYSYHIKSLKKDRGGKDSAGKFWAGFDLSSGYFDPNYSQTASNEIADVLVRKNNSDGRKTAVPELSENMRGGVSYSVGLNFGMDMKERWSVETGVQYSLLGARTLTNLLLESRTYNRAVAFSSEISGLQTVSEIVEDGLTELSVENIDLNNTFQFISMPVLAGYTVLDQKLNVRINGGVAANLYLGNKLSGSSGSNSFDIAPGSTSPYRELTFAGIAGLELGYRIMERVNITFEPNYQRSLQSLTKGDSNFATNPSGVGIQAGFKYGF